MPQIAPNSAALADALALQTELVDSKIRLFKTGFVPSVSTTRAQLVAEEVVFTGYPAGGAEIALWLAPVAGVPSGFSITSPAVQFAAASPFTATDVAAGYWLETADAVVRAIGTFPAPIPLGAAGQGFPISITLAYPAG